MEFHGIYFSPLGSGPGCDTGDLGEELDPGTVSIQDQWEASEGEWKIVMV